VVEAIGRAGDIIPADAQLKIARETDFSETPPREPPEAPEPAPDPTPADTRGGEERDRDDAVDALVAAYDLLGPEPKLRECRRSEKKQDALYLIAGNPLAGEAVESEYIARCRDLVKRIDMIDRAG
jgi:hypothetical protein